MALKNVLIVVKNTQVSAEFYTQIFDMRIMREYDGKIMLTSGLVLQDKAIWENCIQKAAIPYNHAAVIYFEVYQLETFAQKLKTHHANLRYLNQLTQLSDGRKFLRFYDLDGHIIEVGEVAV